MTYHATLTTELGPVNVHVDDVIIDSLPANSNTRALRDLYRDGAYLAPRVIAAEAWREMTPAQRFEATEEGANEA